MQYNRSMIGCQFVEVRPGQWKCIHCKRPTPHGRHYDEAPHRMCRNAPDLKPAAERLAEKTGDPSIVDNVVSYGMALGQWIASGFKCRTDEEVRRIYTEHCLPCEKRDPEVDGCRAYSTCGKTDGMTLRSRSKMATEACPLEKW